MNTETARSKRGESLARRQSRSVHEKHRRLHMNDVLSEMTETIPDRFFEDESNSSSEKINRRPNKCGVISAAVHYMRELTKNEKVATVSTSAHCQNLLTSVVLVLKEWRIEEVTGSALNVFGCSRDKMTGKDIRQYLHPNTAQYLMSKNLFFWPLKLDQELVLETLHGKKISCSNAIIKGDRTVIAITLIDQDEERVPPKVFEAPTPVVEMRQPKLNDRPLLAALLMKPEPDQPCSSKDTRFELNSSNPRTITPSLHCDSPTTSFLSPESASSVGSMPKSIQVPTMSDEKKNPRGNRPSTMKKTSRKRLKSVNAIVESFSLDEVPVDSNPTVRQELNKPTTTEINPYEALSPAYREIWLHLQSQRLRLEEQVKAKEIELQSLMLSTFTHPIQTHYHGQLMQMSTTNMDATWNLAPRNSHHNL